jgi:hypothetical protein
VLSRHDLCASARHPKSPATPRFKPHFNFFINAGMAQMGRAEGYEQELSSDDDLDIVKSTRKGLADADKYIERK